MTFMQVRMEMQWIRYLAENRMYPFNGSRDETRQFTVDVQTKKLGTKPSGTAGEEDLSETR